MKFSLGKPKPLIKLMTSVSTIAEVISFFARNVIKFGLYEISQYKKEEYCVTIPCVGVLGRYGDGRPV